MTRFFSCCAAAALVALFAAPILQQAAQIVA